MFNFYQQKEYHGSSSNLLDQGPSLPPYPVKRTNQHRRRCSLPVEVRFE